MHLLCILLAATVATLAADAAAVSKPHLLFILADDLGWNDVGWRNPAMHTPTLDRLAAEGVVLDSSYVLQSCCPSRSALMSGRYPYRYGLQQEGISAGHPAYLPGEFTLIPQTLKTLGYATHAIGKWHLGFCNWRYTPTHRGFDSFYGYYNAEEDYFEHTGHRDGYDFRDNEEVDWTAKGHYSTHLYANRAVQILRQHNPTTPLFMYLAFQAVHGQLQVPEEYVQRFCSHIPERNRQLKCGMTAAMDEAVANVTAALHETGLYNDTLIVFSSDNGGPIEMEGSNWPLRGGKITIWEGGTRAAAFIHAPYILQKSGYTNRELFHIVDWFPTLVEAGGGNSSSLSGIDGISQWQSLLTGSSGPREEFVYNVNDIKETSALRWKNFKLVKGFPGNPQGWYVPPELTNETTFEPAHSRHDPETYTLYDIDNDPSERTDVLAHHPDVFQRMKARLDEYSKSMHPSIVTNFVNDANPRHFNGAWSPGFC